MAGIYTDMGSNKIGIFNFNFTIDKKQNIFLIEFGNSEFIFF